MHLLLLQFLRSLRRETKLNIQRFIYLLFVEVNFAFLRCGVPDPAADLSILVIGCIFGASADEAAYWTLLLRISARVRHQLLGK